MVIQEKISAQFFFRNGASITLTEKNIISASVRRQCCPDSSFEIGGVYSASLSMTASVTGTNSYNIRGAKIILENQYGNETALQQMGVFWVTQAQRISGDLYSLTAQDAVGWLDTSSMANGSTENLTQVLANYSASNTTLESPAVDGNRHGGWCGRIMEYVNDVLYSIIGERPLKWDLFNEKENGRYTNNWNFNPIGEEGIRELDFICTVQKASGLTDSPRELLHYIAELAGGFIYAKENGSLTLGQFGQEEFGQAEIFSDETEAGSCEIAEYQLQRVLVSIKGLSGTVSSWTGISDFVNLVPLQIIINHNPFAEGFETLAIEKRDRGEPYDTLDALKEGLYYFHHRKDADGHLTDDFCYFRPFHCKVHKQERFHLGQRIAFNLYEDEPKKSTITSIKWTFRGGWELACAGEDSRSMADALRRSKADKALTDAKLRCESLLSKISGGGE